MAPAINDLTDGEPNPRKKPTRRETILSLVEMLLTQSEEAANAGRSEQPAFEDDKDVPTVDEHIQSAGAEAFQRFERRINNLDKELRNFANAARQLGSSAAILSSAYHLRLRLAHVLHLYRENAMDLFPRKFPRRPEAAAPLEEQVKAKVRKTLLNRIPKLTSSVARPVVDEKAIDGEDFPAQFLALAKDVNTFMITLNEFPEFMDEAVNASITSFEGDLKYWSSCLEEYEGQFKYPAVQRYLHDLSTEMGDHLDNITATLSVFIEIGVPTIRFAQKHGATNLLNLSTVATFFSAVTATTLQFSYEAHTSPAEVVVNTFWFASLVFSIGAAVNSLLGLTWKQAMYRSPGNRVPWWVLIWIKRSPLVFLVMSVASFSIGLCAFAYSSGQDHITKTITTVFTALTSFGLLAVSAWFASERWIFLRHGGKKWLSDILVEMRHAFIHLDSIQATWSFFGAIKKQFKQQFKRAGDRASRLGSRTMSILPTFQTDDSSEKLDDDMEANTMNVGSPHEREHSTGSRLGRGSESTVPGSPEPDSTTPANSPPGSPVVQTEGKKLWRNAIRTVRMRSAVSSNLAAMPRAPHRQRTTSSTLAAGGKSGRSIGGDESPGAVIQRSRVTALQPKLKALEATQDLAAHQALVRHLQFSPDGKFLATSSWDRTSVIFRVGDPFVSHRILAHTKGFVGQVAWSPSGKYLLTKLLNGMKVWTVDGVCQKTIDRQVAVETVTWFPGGDAFLSVEGNNATKLDLNGKVLYQYNFGKIKLHDVAITHDSVRLLGVGPLLTSPTGLVPSRSRGEKRVVVYNMETREIEHQTPVLNDVRDITLSHSVRHGIVALVSYENKAPPQLWKLEFVKNATDPTIQTARLTLRHTYMPKVVVDFAGPSYFGGKNNELVLCAGKAGDIHIWDQASGALLHHIRAVQGTGDLTCIAWNQAAEDPFMFATGSHDGAIRIWTKPSELDYDNGLPPRTASPFDLEGIERTDSPITQPGSTDSGGTSRNPSRPDSRAQMDQPRERLVAFVEQLLPGASQ